MPSAPATDALRYRLDSKQSEPAAKLPGRGFSPVGEWIGTYTCASGTTGSTIHISSVHGEKFDGTLRFYPTPKNPYVASGSYQISGEYDADNARILINPGKWIQQPKSVMSTTIIIGSFDPNAKTFSGFFQGITGCTSLEARRYENGEVPPSLSEHKITKKKETAKTAVKKAKKAKPAAKTVKKEAKPKTPETLQVGASPATPPAPPAPPAAPAPVPAQPVPPAPPHHPSPVVPPPTAAASSTSTPNSTTGWAIKAT